MATEALLAACAAAFERRGDLLAALRAERTDCHRLLHGIAEGAPGLCIDRYGDTLLLQTFREALDAATVDRIGDWYRTALDAPLHVVHNHRGAPPPPDLPLHRPDATATSEQVIHEAGAAFCFQARHRGQDPWLFLDLRAGRRALRALAPGRSLLNLFAYTCSAGVAAACAGAVEVLNVDFAASALEVGRRSAARNALPDARCSFLQSDCLPVLRQLAGQPVQRRGRRARHPHLEPRRFDLVLLDPPRWSKGPFGAVDVVRDYASLFKPCVGFVADGGTVIATNHVPEVDRATFAAELRRIAEKAGRPLRELELLAPDADFPSFDGEAPLKIAVARF